MNPLKFTLPEDIEFKILEYAFLKQECKAFCRKNQHRIKIRLISKKYAYGKYHIDVLKYVELIYYTEQGGFTGITKCPKYFSDNWFNIGILEIYHNGYNPYPRIPDINGIRHLILKSSIGSEFHLTEQSIKNIKNIEIYNNVKVDMNLVKQIPSVKLHKYIRGKYKNDNIIDDFKKIKRLELSGRMSVKTNELSHLQKLTLEYVKVDEMSPLGKIPILSLSHVYSDRKEPETVKFINSVPFTSSSLNLTGLNNHTLILEQMDITDDTLKQLGKDIQNITLKYLYKVTNIDSIANIPNITLENLNEVKSVKSLGRARYLKLYGLDKITDISGLGSVNHLVLEHMTNLKSIKLACNMNFLHIYVCHKLTDIDICGRIRMIYMVSYSYSDTYLNLSVQGMCNNKIYPPIVPIKIDKIEDINKGWNERIGIKNPNIGVLEYLYLDGVKIASINVKNVENLMWKNNTHYINLSHLSGKVGSIQLENIYEPGILDRVYDQMTYVNSFFG